MNPAAAMENDQMHAPRDPKSTRQVPTAGDRTDVDSVGLWDALERARADDDPGALAAAEDGVVRFYLPLAHAFARALVTAELRRVAPTRRQHRPES